MEFEDFLNNEEGSDNELTWNDEDNDSDGNDPTNENNNKVGSKRKSVKNHDRRDGKKMRKERKVAPPTAEEMIHLRETETLFKSNLFRLEIEEMLKEVQPLKTFRKASQIWIDKFKKILGSLKEDEDWIHVSETDWLNEYEILFPLPDNFKMYNGVYKFLRPVDVKAVGSYNVECSMGPKFNVDIAVILPRGFFRKKDYLNQLYHFKRALYLCRIAGQLKNSELVADGSQMEFTYANGDTLKPVLIVNPKGKAAGKVQMMIYVVPEEDVFKLHKFSPNSNNIRVSWWKESDDNEDLDIPTPMYNTSIMEDLVMESNERLRKEAFEDNDNMKEAVCLLRVWLRQRLLDQGYGAFTSYLMSMVLVYLKGKQKINKHMSSYQVVRNVWLYLSQSDWTRDGASMCLTESTLPLSLFLEHFDVVFIDPSGYLNLAARMNKLTYLKVRSESAAAIECLDTTEINGFQALFMVKMSFIRQYDHLICFPSELMGRVASKHSPSLSEMDYNYDWMPLFTKLVSDLLIKGLGERVVDVGLMLNEPIRWPASSAPPLSSPGDIAFGLRLHSKHALCVIERGPQANLPEAKEFREFWSGKSELRRFKDGDVSECVVWEDGAAPLACRLTITKKVVSFLLNEKLSIKPQEYIYVADQLDHIITDKLANISAEEACIRVHKSLEELSRQLTELEDLPLEVTSVHCISPSYRYSDVFPPRLPLRRFCSSSLSTEFTPRGSHLVDSPEFAPPFIPIGRRGKKHRGLLLWFSQRIS